MAEVFGVAASALSVAALFNNCVDCFEYIQLIPPFGPDADRRQLRLDIARNRLGRWGEAAAINTDPRFPTNARDSRQVRAILEEIALLFHTTRESSKQYKIHTRPDAIARFEAENMPPVFRKLHDQMRVIARQRQDRTGLLNKSAWTLYNSKNCDKLVEQIARFLDDLEKLFPVETTRRKLAELEIEEMNNETSLLLLKNAAAGVDSVLFEAIANKISGIRRDVPHGVIQLSDGDCHPYHIVEISDIRSERFAEDDAREQLSSYVVIRLEKMGNIYGVDDEGFPLKRNWERAKHIRLTDLSQQEVKRQVRRIERDTKPLAEKRAACSPAVQRQLEIIQQDLSHTDPDKRFCHQLVQFESKLRMLEDRELQYLENSSKGGRNDKKGKKHVAHSKKSRPKPKYERVAITAYFKRMPTPEQSGLRMLEEEEKKRQMAIQEEDDDDEHGPVTAPAQFPTPDESVNSRHEDDSVGSLPEISDFDQDGRSRATYPTTMATSQPTTKDGAELKKIIARSALTMGMEAEQEGESSKAAGKEAIPGDDFSANVDIENNACRRDSDAETTYSMDSILDDTKLVYLQAFSDQLSRDLVDDLNNPRASGLKHEYLEIALKTFAWKLHGESSNPFQWWASVVLHRNRREIASLLSQTRTAGIDSIRGAESDEEPERELFQRPSAMTSDWLSQVEPGLLDDPWKEDLISDSEDELDLFQFADYEQFVRKSGAYKWLLSKIRQFDRLTYGNSDFLSEIGTQIQNRLWTQEPLRQISGRKPSSTVTMVFSLDWNPMSIFLERELDLTLTDVFERAMCLTGTVYEAQATTVVEYMAQTWPETGEHIIALIKKLISSPEGEECVYQLPESPVTLQDKLSDSVPPIKPNAPQLRAQIHGPSDCSISVTGGLYFVSEIAEQVGWLAATLRCCPNAPSRGVVTCTPRVKDLRITGKEVADSAAAIKGSCRIVFDFKQVTENDGPAEPNGLCWVPLFMRPILVSGYPILRRPEKNTGIEMSLRFMACLVRSREVVQWDERIIIKGFSSLLVATLVTAGTVVWHLLVSGSLEERISYVDPELDNLDIRMPEGFSLRDLEGSRHFVGWCANATDMCGYRTAALNVTASGLRKPPASIVIDKLYIEAGSDFVGGLNMSFNKKEQPFWLEREKDYPSLLKWVSLQPIVFYDVSDRRAWLVDGASALLHLLRISLYLDEHDPESTYDWVFDASKFKDQWNGCTGRHAALKTLKSWDNLDLNLYIISKRVLNGEPVTEHSKLETRVKKILHSIEILIDVQVKVASQDGVRIPQTLDPRRGITGFDILDVISPLGPVHARMQHINAWGPGWRDLLPAVGITAIFGNGFGNLICPDDPSSVCSKWKCVPTGSDYLAASVSTLQMLHERRLTRMEPGLGVGELTKKVVWLSSSDPLRACQCVETLGACHVNPVQFLMPKRSWDPRLISKPMTPVDVVGLGQQGTVIFGHMALLGRGREGKDAVREDQESDQGEQSVAHSVSTRTQGSVHEALGPSTTGSTAGSSVTQPSMITVPSVEASIDNLEEGKGEGGEGSSANKSGKGTKTLQKLRKWIRK